jgi:hypothetical protein
MKNILTTEEKKYLNMICNYLKSLGMREGTISIELEYNQYSVDENTINWEYVTHFDNNYRAEIPEGLLPILKKVWSYVVDEGLYELTDDVDMVNYNSIEINIDSDDKTLTVRNDYSYYTESDGSSTLYDSEEEKEMFDGWMENELKETEVPEDGYLTIKYNGSGDSGYMEGNFEETGDPIPAEIEDWCYRELESNYGGWEINEGSQGMFIFNFNDSTITLEHTDNVEESESNTLFEVKFSL